MGSLVEDADDRETVYVAVGTDLEKGKTTLIWAVRNLFGRKICLLHVHLPEYSVASKDAASAANDPKLLETEAALHKVEMQKMHEVLTEYLSFLSRLGVCSDKVWIEMESIEKGIMESISQYNIRWLVMGTDEDAHNSKNQPALTSRKAIQVCKNAPDFLHIWFVSDGRLVYTRGGRDIESGEEIASILLFLTSDTESRQSDCSKPGTLANEEKPASQLANPPHCILDRSKSSTFSSNSSMRKLVWAKETGRSSLSCLHLEAVDDDSEENLRRLRSQCSECPPSTSKSSCVIKQEGRIHEKGVDEMYLKLEQFIVDGEYSRQKEFEESVQQSEEEDNAIEEKSLEGSCAKELDRRKEMERMLRIKKQEADRMKSEHQEIMKELQLVQEQKSILEKQLSQSSQEVDDLEKKIISAVELLISFKEKRDRVRTEHKKALKELRRLSRSVKCEDASFCGPHILSFSFIEITEATNSFNPSWKIGEGRCGAVYRGFLRHMEVAIKMLPSFGSQRTLDFQQEVEVFSRVRHPNLVTLIGTCPESRSLVYEYLRNGSLDKRLACKNNTPPVPWHVRVLIAIDICSALVFLHSHEPPIVHGNLRPSNILLDANFVGKVSDVGISRFIPDNVNHEKTTVYMDPEYSVGETLTPASDVYSLGIILLQLISNRALSSIVKDVRCALENGHFDKILDGSAGDWPFHHTIRLAYLALRCCSLKSVDRPDIVSVWKPLQSVRTKVAASPRSKRLCQAPSHFVCPIMQEVMKDPLIAADGFTYEAEAITEWFSSGHVTSPMTNLMLDDCNLVPNHALLYAIQDWRQLL